MLKRLAAVGERQHFFGNRAFAAAAAPCQALDLVQAGILRGAAFGGEGWPSLQPLHQHAAAVDQAAPVGPGQAVQRANGVAHAEGVGCGLGLLGFQRGGGVRQGLGQRHADGLAAGGAPGSTGFRVGVQSLHDL